MDRSVRLRENQNHVIFNSLVGFSAFSCFYGNPYRRISSDSQRRIRVFPDLRNADFTPWLLYDFTGMHISDFGEMHESASADWRVRAKAPLCIHACRQGEGAFRHAAMTLSLITETEREQLLANGRARAAGEAIDPLPVVRLFTPDAHATWLLASLDPVDEDTASGLCDLGIGMPALGTVKLSELASIVGPLMRPIRRDLYFRATRTLSEYTRLAQLNGSIMD
ncbi:hypothetical protein D9M70_418890 [compost metagenome]